MIGHSTFSFFVASDRMIPRRGDACIRWKHFLDSFDAQRIPPRHTFGDALQVLAVTPVASHHGHFLVAVSREGSFPFGR